MQTKAIVKMMSEVSRCHVEHYPWYQAVDGVLTTTEWWTCLTDSDRETLGEL